MLRGGNQLHGLPADSVGGGLRLGIFVFLSPFNCVHLDIRNLHNNNSSVVQALHVSDSEVSIPTSITCPHPPSSPRGRTSVLGSVRRCSLEAGSPASSWGRFQTRRGCLRPRCRLLCFPVHILTPCLYNLEMLRSTFSLF